MTDDKTFHVSASSPGTLDTRVNGFYFQFSHEEFRNIAGGIIRNENQEWTLVTGEKRPQNKGGGMIEKKERTWSLVLQSGEDSSTFAHSTCSLTHPWLCMD